MGEARLEVIDPAGGTVVRSEPIRVNGRSPTFELASERIEARALHRLDPHAQDLLTIAACVMAADTGISRGGPVRSGFGESWRRRIRLTIPVRDPGFWSDPSVRSTIIDALTFLSDDDFEIRFNLDVDPSGETRFFDFDPLSDHARSIDEVILFSGGIDSFAGALETLATTNKHVALVTRRSAPKTASRQERLAQVLLDLFPGRVVYIPVRAHRVGSEARENSQRTRSFLFTAIAFGVASSFGANTIRFFENGVVSHQLPISEQVIGTMATRTTHPLSLRLLGEVLGKVDATIRLSNPFEWLTKTQVVERLRSHGGTGFLKDTTSCSSVFTRTTLHTHCGACSQCIDRRFAVLACDLAGDDPADAYETDVLTGVRNAALSRIMALDWAQHARRLSEMGEIDFIGRFGSEVSRICEGYPDEKSADMARRVLDLHRRHGQSAREVLINAITDNADLIEKGSLPPHSLLAAFLSLQVGANTSPGLVDPPSIRQPAFAIADQETDRSEPDFSGGPFPLKVSFGRPNGNWSVDVRNLGTVRGQPARVAHALRPSLEEEQRVGRPTAEHRFVSAGELASATGKSKAAIGQNVVRCRRELAEFHKTAFGTPPDADLLIENRRQHGYRLDPTCEIVT